MSREDLNSFINAAERNHPLRTQLKKCKSLSELIDIAAQYGFNINSKDLEEDFTAEKIGEWFENSQIAPTRKTL